MLVQLVDTQGRSEVFVNPEHVVRIFPYKDTTTTYVVFDTGDKLLVEGDQKTVADKLNQGLCAQQRSQ